MGSGTMRSRLFKPGIRIAVLQAAWAIMLAAYPLETLTMTTRPPPPAVAPVEYAGIRYIQDTWDTRNGDQPGGYLVAIDMRTDTRLWRIAVYKVPANHPAGLAPIEIFFQAMSISPDGGHLRIEDEVGGTYRVDLRTRAVEQIGGPPDESAPRLPRKPKPVP